MTNGAVVGRPKKRLDDSSPEPKTVGMRVSGEYAEWLEALAKHYRTTVAGLIDRAVAEWSEAEGYPIRPPDRTP